MIDKIEESHSHKSGKSAPKQKRVGLSISRHFASPDKEPFDEIEWERRTAEITDEKGKSIFQQKDVEVPKAWSMMATKVVVQKYFRGAMDTPEREYSVKQLINRVADTIATWGMDQGYFQDDMSCKAFVDDLKFLLVNQHMAFNSPVWFNLGIEKFPQVSACFINSVDDSMDSILGLAKTEGMLFKYGSGTGTNFSTLRSSKELLNGGGTSSGPISFMKGFDAFAGVIKSGGKTRRAAKMVILNAEHPDIVDFINCKVKEEKKAWALIDAGYDGSFTGEAYGSVFFQNSNNSVRVTDEFMEAVQDDRDWVTKAVRDGRPTETFKAKDLWHQIADAAWQCGDPGLQYDTTINTWHTSPNTARINASNPCSEYMYLDDSACNLASLNLRKFQKLDGSFDVERFEHAVDVTILAQEIMVDKARYPTAKIEENSHRFRPLGLGYANLGALLMSRGLPYDSDAGRAYAGAVTALMHGRANRMSAKISGEATGPFSGYEENKDPFMMVMRMHQKALSQIDSALAPVDILNAASDAWHDVVSLGPVHGFRNGQVTVLAPTGTIGFMMDCDTTGVEPDIALVKYKRLVGGGLLKIVNQTVPEALNCLGYSAAEKDLILRHIDANDTIEGSPTIKPEHLAVFDCAFKATKGERSIHYMGHIKMMAAAQPFLSGAISKTVNLPNDCTIDDIKNAYLQSWVLGLKAVAVYRDGCKRSQPMSTSKTTNKDGTLGGEQAVDKIAAVAQVIVRESTRRKLPETRDSLTHKFSIGGHDGYLTVGMYEDRTPGEIFIRMAKEGSTISGLMDSFATITSIALQHHVPLRMLVDKFKNTKFEPAGWTENPQIQRASSVMDYIARFMELKFLSSEAKPVEVVDKVISIDVGSITPEQAHDFLANTKAILESKNGNGNGSHATWKLESDAPPCPLCGSITVRNGACHKCLNCGESLGCS